MASLMSRSLIRRPMRPVNCVRCSHRRQYAVPSSTELPAPPLLLKLRNDLKTAMRNKDTTRLNVLRGLLAEVTNSAKTNNPIKNDMQLLSLLRKRASAASTAGEEFRRAGRDDLVKNENDQLEVLNEYAKGVETMSVDQIRTIVAETIARLKEAGKVTAGDVLKKLFAPGGILDNRPVEKAQVARIVKESL